VTLPAVNWPASSIASIVSHPLLFPRTARHLVPSLTPQPPPLEHLLCYLNTPPSCLMLHGPECLLVFSWGRRVNGASPLIAQPHVPPNRLSFVAGLLLCVEGGAGLGRGWGGQGRAVCEKAKPRFLLCEDPRRSASRLRTRPPFCRSAATRCVREDARPLLSAS